MASEKPVPPQEPPNFNGYTPYTILKEVTAILRCSSAFQDQIVASISIRHATFANAVRPLVDDLNRAKCRLQILGKVLVAASPDASLREASCKAQKLILAADTSRLMRADVAALVYAVYESSQNDDSSCGLDEQDRYLLKRTYNGYRESGAALAGEEQRARLRHVQAELDDLRLAAQKSLTDIDDGIWFSRSELSGVDETSLLSLKVVSAADGDASKDQIWIPFNGPVSVQVMQDAIKSETRRKHFVASKRRFPDNVNRLERIIVLRQEAAELLGFSNHASLRMGEKMAESVTDVELLLHDVIERLKPFAQKEIKRLLQLKKHDIDLSISTNPMKAPESPTLFAWDWGFYAKKLRQDEFSINTTKLSEYFEAMNTFKEMLIIFEKLFSIEFVRVEVSTWHESVYAYAAWDNSEEGSSFLGYLYVDLFARDGKYRNAQHIPINRGFVEANGTKHYPNSALIFSLPAPKPEKPTLLFLAQIRTLFHELGHAIHNLSSRTKYGIMHSRDFVEIPSLMLEHWIWHPEVLMSMGKHHKHLDAFGSAEYANITRECNLPLDLALAVNRTKNLHKAHNMLLEVQRALFDLAIHTPKDISSAKSLDTTLLWNRTRRDIVGLNFRLLDDSDESIGFEQAAFGHIFRAYDAGFFAYPVSKVYAADLYNTVFANDPLNSSIARRYRYEILERGSSQSEMKTLEAFLGRKPTAESFHKEVASMWA